MAPGADDGSGHRGARVRAVGGFSDGAARRGAVAGEVELPLFNPGGEARPRSVLRLANAGRRACDGDGGRRRRRGTCGRRGDGGAWGVGVARLHGVGAGGRIGGGLSGSLGDGIGKWRLFLEAERGTAYATNLLLHGSVLSSVPGGMSRGPGGVHRVSLFPSASDGAGRRGAVRVVNPVGGVGGGRDRRVRRDGPRLREVAIVAGRGFRRSSSTRRTSSRAIRRRVSREARDRARATGGWS